MPTKDELKAKYNIPNDDFEIRDKMPSTEEIVSRGWLQRVENFSGAAVSIWKDWGGTVIGVILTYYLGDLVAEFAKPLVWFGASQFYNYILTKFPEPTVSGVVVFLPPGTGISGSTGYLPFDQLPVGSGIFPASGQYKPA